MTSPPVPQQALSVAWPLWLHEHTHGLPCSEQVYNELKAAFLAGWKAAAPHLTEQARAAERRRIEKLARRVGARYHRSVGNPASFADLLKEDTP